MDVAIRAAICDYHAFPDADGSLSGMDHEVGEDRAKAELMVSALLVGSQCRASHATSVHGYHLSSAQVPQPDSCGT